MTAYIKRTEISQNNKNKNKQIPKQAEGEKYKNKS
jgi:hypothetical protein